MKLALDIGNSTVKGTILTDTNTIIKNLKCPSAVTHISDDKYLTFTDENDRFFQVTDSALRHYDGIVAIGERALDIPGYQEFDVTSTSYKADHPITTSLLFGSVLEGVKDLQQDMVIPVTLAVSIPIVESKSIGLADAYKAKLEGSHELMVHTKDQEYHVTVQVVKAMVQNEGQSGFLGMLDTTDKQFRHALSQVYTSLGESGDPVSSFEDFLIVDIGEGTTDLAVFRHKRFNPDYSYSVTRGYGNLLEEAIRNAARENLTIESRKELQSVLESTNPRRRERRAMWESYVTPTKNAFIDSVVDTIIKTYGNRDYFDAIIFLGGGFSALTGYTTDFGQVYMTDDSLFKKLNEQLKLYNKSADLVFGIPSPYAQGINERGLVQILTMV